MSVSLAPVAHDKMIRVNSRLTTSDLPGNLATAWEKQCNDLLITNKGNINFFFKTKLERQCLLFGYLHLLVWIPGGRDSLRDRRHPWTGQPHLKCKWMTQGRSLSALLSDRTKAANNNAKQAEKNAYHSQSWEAMSGGVCEMGSACLYLAACSHTSSLKADF